MNSRHYTVFCRLVALTGSVRNGRRVVARIRLNSLEKILGRAQMGQMWDQMQHDPRWN